MTDRALVDALAYVDDSLDADRRAEFELSLSANPELRRRVTLWQAQNDALRKAYLSPPRSRVHRTLPRPSNENAPPERASRPVGRVYAHPLANEVAERRLRERRQRGRLKLAAVATLSTLFSAFAFGGPVDPRAGLMDAALAAYRAFAIGPAAPLDIATDDPLRLGRWLGARYQGQALEATLAAPDWTLRGARLTPGLQGAAAFVVFENDEHATAGLLIEPVDAVLQAPIQSRRAGGVVKAARVDGGLGLAVVAPSAGLAASVIRASPPRAP